MDQDRIAEHVAAYREATEEFHRIQAAAASASARRCEAVRALREAPMTIRAVADLLGISGTLVSRLEKRR